MNYKDYITEDALFLIGLGFFIILLGVVFHLAWHTNSLFIYGWGAAFVFIGITRPKIKFNNNG